MECLTRMMTSDEFKLFRDLIYDRCGISLNDGKKDFLQTRIERRMRTVDIGSYFHYYRHISDDRNIKELCSFLESITINETSFFRNMPQFEMLRENVLPDLTERKRKTGDYNLIFWSAGCATGEEPYSIAIEILEAIPDVAMWNIQIIASDISLKCLEVASAAIYPKEKLRDVPNRYIQKYFTSLGDSYQVNDEVRRLVVLDFHNLKHENGIINVDVIFCRNVMIYFDAEEQKRIVARFRRVLNTGGYLFLGHAESLYGLTNGDFRYLYCNKGTAYQKVKDSHG